MAEGGLSTLGVGRREVLGTAGVVAACGLALTGCGGDAGATGPAPGLKGQVIAKTSEVPVGGGLVIQKWKIVIAQPSAGVFKAFSAACPHKGCAVGRPRDGKMTCPCHGSEFDATTGACLKGPAEAPLAAFAVRVEGEGLVLA